MQKYIQVFTIREKLQPTKVREHDKHTRENRKQGDVASIEIEFKSTAIKVLESGWHALTKCRRSHNFLHFLKQVKKYPKSKDLKKETCKWVQKPS
jgi:hypothetical protein